MGWLVIYSFFLISVKFYSIFNQFFFVFADSPTPWSFGFQSPATPTMEGIIRFHHDLIGILVFIVFFVG